MEPHEEPQPSSSQGLPSFEQLRFFVEIAPALHLPRLTESQLTRTELIDDLISYATVNETLKLSNIRDLRILLKEPVYQLSKRGIVPEAWGMLRTVLSHSSGYEECRTGCLAIASLHQQPLSRERWEFLSALAHSQPQSIGKVLHGFQVLFEWDQAERSLQALGEFVSSNDDSVTNKLRTAALLLSSLNHVAQVSLLTDLIHSSRYSDAPEIIAYHWLAQERVPARIWEILADVLKPGSGYDRSDFSLLCTDLKKVLGFEQLSEYGCKVLGEQQIIFPDDPRALLTLVHNVATALPVIQEAVNPIIPWNFISLVSHQLSTRQGSNTLLTSEIIGVAYQHDVLYGKLLCDRIVTEMIRAQENEIRTSLVESIEQKEFVRELVRLGTSPRHGMKIQAVLSWNSAPETAELRHLIQELRMKEVTDQLYYAAEPAPQKSQLIQAFEKLSRADRSPFQRSGKPSFNAYESGQHAIQQVILSHSERILMRVEDIAHGSTSMVCDEMAQPYGRESTFMQFARRCAGVAVQIQPRDTDATARRKDHFPGPGLLLSGIDPTRAFVEEPSARARNRDPFESWKKNASFLAPQFDQLPHFQFIITRGMVVISCGLPSEFQMDNVHLALVIFREDMHGEASTGALLVPHQVIQEKLAQARVRSSGKEALDLNSVGFTAAELTRATEEYGRRMKISLPAMTISSRVLRGSLANALPAGSSPYFDYEPQMIAQGAPHDFWNHVHRTSLTRGQKFVPANFQIDAFMEAQDRVHSRIHSITNGLLNGWDWFRYAISLDKKGVNGAADERSALANEMPLHDSGEFDFSDLHGRSSIISSFSLPEAHSPRWRTLRWAYEEHHSGKLRGYGAKQYNVLCLAPILGYRPPVENLFLFTHDLSIVRGGARTQLPLDSDGTGREEQESFYRHYHSKYGSGYDFRFLPRPLVDAWIRSRKAVWW